MPRPEPRTAASVFAVAAAVLATLSGCSTPGPTHAYLANRIQDPIVDIIDGRPEAKVPSYLGSVNELYGLAYDPFTDHLFLRVFPGDFIRVIDRPARKIKRSFFVESLPPGRGDLAIRSVDRHLFFAHPEKPEIVETNLHGKLVRTIVLAGFQGAPAGVAYDQKNDRLLILAGGDLDRVDTYDLQGRRLSGVALDRKVSLASLAYDSAAGLYYAPLADTRIIGVFDLEGRLVRSISTQDDAPHGFVDVGQRSLIRMF